MSYVIPDPRWEEPNLLIPGKKPIGPVVVDWSHPITRALSVCLVPMGGICSNLADASQQSVVTEGTQSGPKIVFNGSQYAVVPVDHIAAGTDRTLMFFSDFQEAGADAWAGVFTMPNNSGAGNWFGCFQRTSSSSALTVYADNQTFNVGTFSDYPAGTVKTAIYTDSTRRVSTYADTDTIADNVAKGTGGRNAISPDPTLHLNASRGGGARGVQDFYAAFVWARALRDAERFSMTRNPYQFLIPA